MNKVPKIFDTDADFSKAAWYDDRYLDIIDLDSMHDAATDAVLGKGLDLATPKGLYAYLDARVWKQEAAKRAAAMLTWKCLESGVRSNVMFVGPTGCGKTHIWRCMRDLYPDRIVIKDASNITQDGWRGGKKWSTLLADPKLRGNSPAILVLDEADKMLSPKTNSADENVSEGVQSEALAMMEGASVEVHSMQGERYVVDTSRISFVFCGAFSGKAREIAKKSSGASIGFGASPNDVKAYDRELTVEDMLDCGVMPEFMGRIDRIVGLAPMTADDFYDMAAAESGPVRSIARQYRISLSLTEPTRRRLADEAAKTGLGVRCMEGQIRSMLDDRLFDDCSCAEFEL